MNEEQDNSQKQQKTSPPQEQQTPLPGVWDSAQEWMKEHKVITAIATVAVLYLLGGRRIKQIANFAVKSGVTAGLANVAMGTLMSQNKSETKNENVYH